VGHAEIVMWRDGGHRQRKQGFARWGVDIRHVTGRAGVACRRAPAAEPIGLVPATEGGESHLILF
jgi:hypothetical protein